MCPGAGNIRLSALVRRAPSAQQCSHLVSLSFVLCRSFSFSTEVTFTHGTPLDVSALFCSGNISHGSTTVSGLESKRRSDNEITILKKIKEASEFDCVFFLNLNLHVSLSKMPEFLRIDYSL